MLLLMMIVILILLVIVVILIVVLPCHGDRRPAACAAARIQTNCTDRPDSEPDSEPVTVHPAVPVHRD